MIGFNLNDFKAQLGAKGFTKSNKFLVRFPTPSGMTDYIEQVRVMEYWAEAAALPGAMLATYDANRYSYGAREKRPFAPVFQDQAFSFLADASSSNDVRDPTKNTNYDFFTTWLRLCVNFNKGKNILGPSDDAQAINQTPYEVAYKTDYVVDLTVGVFDDNGNQSHVIVLRDAFPIMVSDIRVNWGDNSGIIKIPVIMTFTDWYRGAPLE
jgi:hypothetical protein